MVPHLIATQFERFMTSGRTSPAVFGCRNNEDDPVGEYVIKLRGAVGEQGSINELVGNRLASWFQIPVPEPAVVSIGAELARIAAGIRPEKASLLISSAGLNFGSEALIGFSTWPVDKHIPEALRQCAIEIFAFDALIQNPDRRQSNPNLLTKGDRFVVYDHEIAFSFLLDILPSRTPWKLAGQAYLYEHAFYPQLRSKEVDLSGFTARLFGLSDAVINGFFGEIPAEWKNEKIQMLGDHIGAMRGHAEEFAEEVRRFLI
jgi:hypothetical protein